MQKLNEICQGSSSIRKKRRREGERKKRAELTTAAAALHPTHTFISLHPYQQRSSLVSFLTR